MSVAGQYKATFAEATHCLFNGHMDNPDFLRLAIQQVSARTTKEVTLSRSGTLPIKSKGGKEYVELTYHGFFGKQRTTGHPFKDDRTELPNDRVEGRDAASSRRVPSHDGLCGNGSEVGAGDTAKGTK